MNTTFKKISALLVCAVLMLTLVSVFAVSAEETEVTYLQDGLVAWYDGVDNEANGTHNNDATVWQNKVNTTEDWAITLTPDADDHFTDEGFAVHDNRQFFPNSFVDVINGEAWTLEVSLGEFVGLGNAYNTFINCDNDNFSLFNRVDGDYIEFKAAGNARPKVPGGADYADNSTLSVTFDLDSDVVLYVDGVEIGRAMTTETINADTLFVGHYDAARNWVGNVYGIRFYDRALTAEEVAQNAAYDAQFRGGAAAVLRGVF